jgi:phage-related protein
MSDSIYNISNWAATTAYSKHDVVKYQSAFYYAKANHTSGGSFDSSKWHGTTLFNSETKPLFPWVPSYNSNVEKNPNVKLIRFGDSYEQRIPNGINNNLLNLTLSFDKKSDDEATAILHFLERREGIESFVFTPPKPYNTQKKFICRGWVEVFAFFNNHTIRASFEEVAN